MDRTVRVPAGAGASVRVCIPPDAMYGRYVRRRVARFAASHNVPEPDASDFLTAVAEAVANALEHSRSEDTIEINCWIVDGDKLFASVVDRGVGFSQDLGPTGHQLPNGLTERGRGMPIMKRCVDLFTVRSVPGKGTAVVLGRDLRRAVRGARDPEFLS